MNLCQFKFQHHGRQGWEMAVAQEVEQVIQ